MTNQEFFERYTDSTNEGYAVRRAFADSQTTITGSHSSWTWPKCSENEYGTLHHDPLRIALRALFPREREQFVAGYLEWQRSRPRCPWKGQEELNTRQTVIQALDDQFHYPNDASLSVITAMSDDELERRASELLAA